MAKISRATRETIQTILVLVLAIALILVYVVYPLNRSKAFFGRVGLDNYSEKIKPINDPAPLDSAASKIDTVRLEADGLTNLACVSAVSAGGRGTVIIPLTEQYDRSKAAGVVKILADSGFALWLYDQRAVGASTGKYHSDGQLESQDLESVVSYLELHGKLTHPVIAVGFGLAGDAAMLATAEEKRLDAVLAVDPYLTTERMVTEVRKSHSIIWFPFWQKLLWWWYKTRSGYAIDFRTTGDLKPVAGRTLLELSPDRIASADAARLKDISPAELLRIIPVESSDQDLVRQIISLTRP
jgi:hypothetical protein